MVIAGGPQPEAIEANEGNAMASCVTSVPPRDQSIALSRAFSAETIEGYLLAQL